MFEYKTRTETINGCKFYEQDVLLFDYSYSGDCVIECVVDYIIPGFGFVLLEDSGNDISRSENMYIVKFGKRNQYQIINRQLLEQITVRDEFILGAKDINVPYKNLRLVFKFRENDRIEVYYADKDEYGINVETLLIEYRLPHEITRYKLGFYSNGGNTIKFASIESEAPSNWVSNVFNGNGGRINWITNGFQIEDCEYDCEVESQNNFLEAGTYYFDFVCDNPDIKYYIYPAPLKDTDEKRPLDLILATREDEVKNILNYEDNSFTFEEDSRINIKFKGKWGTVRNICLKMHKNDTFVETDYDSIKREASKIEFDLSKISKIEITATVTGVPNTDNENNKPIYDLFLCGPISIILNDVGVELNKEINYTFNVDDRLLEVNDSRFDFFKDTTDNTLTAFHNVNAYISKLIITTIAGDEIDVLLQKTFRITVNKNIHTPIIVTDTAYNPLDLSSSYREVTEPEQSIEIFNRYNQIKLSKRMCLNDANVRIAGINDGQIDLSQTELENIGTDYTLISPNRYVIDYEHNTIKLNQTERERYKYIAVEYTNCDNFRIEFTNYEREIFDLNEETNLYLNTNVCDVVGAMIAYGIPKDSKIYTDYIYRIPDIRAINSIDYCAPVYNVLLSDAYTIGDANKISLAEGIRQQYGYLIIDYLKKDSYTVNERERYYEVDIATDEEQCIVLYDSTETEITNTYKQLNLDNIQEDNFIVLRKREV